jgi:uncharacterized protein (TIGR02611 family)
VTRNGDPTVEHEGEHEEAHHHLFVETDEDDWAWRRRIRSDPKLAVPYRVAVLVVGLAITLGGLFLVPLPGPGWLIVFTGIAVLATEFEPAQRLLDWGKGVLHVWNEWLQRRPWWVKGLVGLATGAFVLAVVWAVFKVSGVPGFMPDGVENWLHAHLGL